MADPTLAPFNPNQIDANSSRAWVHVSRVASNREYLNTTTSNSIDSNTETNSTQNGPTPTDRDADNANDRSVTVVQAFFLLFFLAGFPIAFLLLRFCGRNHQQEQLNRQAIRERRKAARAKKAARQALIQKHLIVRQWKEGADESASSTTNNNNHVSVDCEQRTALPTESAMVITRSTRSIMAIRLTDQPLANPTNDSGGDGGGSLRDASETTLADRATASATSRTTRITATPTFATARRSLASRWARRTSPTSSPRTGANATLSAPSPNNGNNGVTFPSGPASSNNNTPNDHAGNPTEPEPENDDEASVASSHALSLSSSSASLQKPCCAICWSHFTRQQWVCQSNNPVCAHVFHRDCMAAWLLKHEECPMCRETFLLIPPEQETDSMALADSEQVPDPNATTDMVVDVEAAEAITIPKAITANVSTPPSSQSDSAQSMSPTITEVERDNIHGSSSRDSNDGGSPEEAASSNGHGEAGLTAFSTQD